MAIREDQGSTIKKKRKKARESEKKTGNCVFFSLWAGKRQVATKIAKKRAEQPRGGGKRMIKLLRVDDRLIHGQVATTWTKTLQADSIIVANDEVIHNELQIIALKLAVPAGMKVAIRSVEEAVGLLQNPKAQPMKIFVVVNHPRDALRIAEAVPETVEGINIGNYYGSKQLRTEEKIKLDRNIYLDPQDVDTLKKICALPIEFTIQMVPHEPKKKVSDCLQHLGC